MSLPLVLCLIFPSRTPRPYLSAILVLILLASRTLSGVPLVQATGEVLPAEMAELNHRASAALAAGDYARAIPLLEQIVLLQPRSGEFHANLGLAYYSTAQYDKAAESFRQAVNLRPDLPHVESFLAMSEAERGRLKESRLLLEKAFAAESDEEIRRMVGLHLEQVYVALGEPLEAAGVVQKLLQLYPQDADVLYLASRLYFQLSSQMIARLVEVAPNSSRVRQLMGELLEANKQYGPAAEQYRKAVALDPQSLGLHYRLGLMLIRSSNDPAAWEEARRAFLDELKIDPNHARCYVELADMLRKKDQLEEAEKLFAHGLAINADLPEALVGLGRIRVTQGRLEDALTHFQKAANLAPTSEIVHFELHRLYARLGRTREAEEEKALYDRIHAERLEKMDNVLFRLDRATESTDSP